MSTARRHLRIGLPSIAIASVLPLAVLGLACSDPAAPASLTMYPVAGTDGQAAETGTALPHPLQVVVWSDGALKAGATVNWQVSAGTILPASSVTDGDGRASATWTLGTVPGTMTATGIVAGAQNSPVTFSATAFAPPVKATIVPASDAQSGVVGTALSQPLMVQVDSAGTPKAGMTIQWHTTAGSVTPTESVSDNDGFASATWTLGTAAGASSADATIAGDQASRVTFRATALSGPAAVIDATGDALTLPANSAPVSLLATVTDQYGNVVEGQAVTWAIQSGPVDLVSVGATTDRDRQCTASVDPSGPAGTAVVRASLPGIEAATDFTLTIGPPTYGVVLRTIGLYAFVSSQNQTTPAVDTIPAGQTMTWTLEFDYDLHGVEAVGSPTFAGGDFPYSEPTVSVTFTAPGTYHYHDPYYPQATGTVVVQ